MMKRMLPIRLWLGAALAISLGVPPCFARVREPQPAAKANRPQIRPGARPPGRQGPAQEHLQQWYERHQTLSIPEQQRALENEPGFHDLPPQTQQQMRDRLVQLNNMSPQQRDRMLERNEALERMSVPERQQYRAAVQSFATMPPDRRRLVARAVLDLRAMPLEQRAGVIGSDRFRSQFSDGERGMIRSLLAAEPYPAAQAATQ
jgi:hypothetical protein